MKKGLLLTLFLLMSLVALTTDGAVRAWLELLGFVLLLGVLLWRTRPSDS